MGQRKKDVTPLLTHWSYVFVALTHRFEINGLVPEWFGTFEINGLAQDCSNSSQLAMELLQSWA